MSAFPTRTAHLTRAIRTAAAVGALVLMLGCSSEPEPEPREAALVRGPSNATPSAGTSTADDSPFWVDPDSPAARQADQWRAQGRAQDAELIERIASQPVAVWPAGDDPGPMVRTARDGAARDGRTAVLVAYNIPHRDCGQYSAGGAHSVDFYRQWLSAFADNIGDAKAIVILEPDAIPHTVDGCTPAVFHQERFQLLAEAIDRLKQQPNVKVYLDAGNPDWIKSPEKLAGPLRNSGIAAADGFALNVSNFQTDSAVRTYGHQLSRVLDGMPFVVDSSRNGNGPLPGARTDAWCNPPGRALGKRPTTDTGDPLIDAYLWIKRPGESDGECRGGPKAGKWWPDYALGLARNSKA
ncbi:glycoside hydrolase family 6 protein [Streptomyces apocyni]|uniref:glycoside hydrolase family 6 protein n=1 Tax=Streptomyces apocyni TaxID=2654677 RepID=UPI001E33A208|nr:glycoside hydrolase family 6 protein [Streptomyces apocyni]